MYNQARGNPNRAQTKLTAFADLIDAMEADKTKEEALPVNTGLPVIPDAVIEPPFITKP
jgi:hypothetical protein